MDLYTLECLTEYETKFIQVVAVDRNDARNKGREVVPDTSWINILKVQTAEDIRGILWELESLQRTS